MDRIDRLEYLPNQASAVEERFPQIPPEALAGSLHLVGPEGEVWEGAEAVERIVTLLPGYTWLSRLFGLPFARPLARAAYRTIARSWYRLSCTQHCSRGSLPDV
jgi:predicted DCC family thiol-disulfide oxidoreductase YuxK